MWKAKHPPTSTTHCYRCGSGSNNMDRVQASRRRGMTYQRTTKYRNWINKRRFLAKIEGSVAELVSGRKYLITPKGWVRMGGSPK